MLVIPSIDIMRGKCVQLVGGRPGTERVFGEPAEIAQKWVAEGAEYLHVIDLDAAMGRGRNIEKVAEVMASVGVLVQVGGGIRTLEAAEEAIGIGAERVIVGTAAVRNPGFAKQLVDSIGGERVIVALDSRAGKVAVDGWKESTKKSPFEMAKDFEKMGVGAILFTVVDVEGSMRGISKDETRKMVETVNIPVIASGGVGTLDDVKYAKEAGAAALVVGMALYEHKFTLQEAAEVAKE